MGTKWVEPVTDRTSLDLASRTGKAYLNVEDLRRIEGNIAYLSECLNGERYGVEAFEAKLWSRGDLPTTADIARICARTEAIAKAYYHPDVYEDISWLSDKRLDITDVNNL